MNIDRVDLKNFRIHKEYSADFTNGIQLIQGKNGYGKTSILEAICFALFNIKTKESSTLEDFKRIDEETGEKAQKTEITVWFTANDNSKCKIEWELKKTVKRTLFINEEEFKEKSLIDKKIAELCGIPDGMSKELDSIIIAKQNQMTGIFSDSSADRKITFDKIFNTEIYNEIGNNVLRDKIKKIASEADKVEGNIKGKLDQLAKYDKLEDMMQNREQLTLTKSSIDLTLEKIKSEIDEINNNEKKETAKKNNIEKTKELIEKDEELLSKFMENIKTAEENINASKEAQSKLTTNKTGYDQYLKSRETAKLLSFEIESMEKTEKKLKEIELQIQKYKEENSNLKVANEKNSERKSELEKELTKKNLEIGQKENELTELKSEIELKRTEKIYAEELHLQYKKKLEQSDKNSNDINNLNQRICELSSSLNNKTKIISAIESLNLELKTLEKSLTEKQILTEKSNELKIKIKELQQAEAELSKGVCPYLKESCKNIADESNSGKSYFSSRIESYTTEKLSLDGEINKLGNIEKLITDTRESITINNSKLSELEKTNEKLQSFSTEKEKLVSLSLELTSDLSGLLKISYNGEILTELTAFSEIDKTSKGLELIEKRKSKSGEILATFEAKKSSEVALLTKLQTECKQIETELSSKNTEINKNNTIISKTEELIQADLIILIKEKDSITSLPLKKNELASENNKIEQNQTAYNTYITNTKIAGEYDKFISEFNRITLETNIHEQNLSKTKDELAKMIGDYNPVTLEKLLLDKQSKEIEHKSTLNQKENIVKLESELNEKIKVVSTISEEISVLEKMQHILNTKKTVLDKLRTNLGTMGMTVAERYMEKAAAIATKNYRRISGGEELITWNHEPNQNYLVSLSKNKNKRGYDMLSGGEQITAALSIRAALAEMFTNMRFAIFDEPTINLDEERRGALAESFNLLLTTLDQAIIVTHDDTFATETKEIKHIKK